MTPTLTLSHCFLPVHDQDVALTFYRDVLGFEVRSDVTMGDFRWLTVGPPMQRDIEINLESPTTGRSKEDADLIFALLAKGNLATLALRTDDIDAAFEQLAAAGAEVIQEPIDQPYGVRDCAFRDPSGNQLRLSQTAPA